MANSHLELHKLLLHLQNIYQRVSDYHPPIPQLPIIDSSLQADDTSNESHWAHQDHIPGLKKLKGALKLDLDGLQKFLDDPSSAHRPPPSTNAPYLISVWNELLCAPGPVLAVFKTFLFEPGRSNGVDDHRAGSRQTHTRKKTPVKGVKKPKAGGRPPGAKVDIVGDGGRLWIRINTIKNTRLLAEFREIDSYMTDSDSDPDWDGTERPTLAPVEFDNSILKMGRSLVQAAQMNPVIEGFTEIPRIVMRLTRLDPGPEPSTSAQERNDEDEDRHRATTDPRIGKTVQLLEDMGITVQLGERSDDELTHAFASSSSVNGDDVPTQNGDCGRLVVPSRRINLDLSVLIALISDLTHAPLPTSIEDANKRFIPPKEYREWKQNRKRQTVSSSRSSDSTGDLRAPLPSKGLAGTGMEEELEERAGEAEGEGDGELSIEDLPHDLATHSRALTNQLLGEMSRSLIQEILDRISDSRSLSPYSGSASSSSSTRGIDDCEDGARDSGTGTTTTEFWVTREARDRCLRIVSKIGAANEKRRAFALFCLDPDTPTTTTTSSTSTASAPESNANTDHATATNTNLNYKSIPLDQAEELFWTGSRFAKGTLPLFPLHFHGSFDGASEGEIPVPAHLLDEREGRHAFFEALAGTCRYILDQETRSNSSSGRTTGQDSREDKEEGVHDHAVPHRAIVTKANPRLTAHTVESMRWGAELGWTTLTANRTSVKAILKEINGRVKLHPATGASDSAAERQLDQGCEEDKGGGQVGKKGQVAALWVVDPRSLAEQMMSGPTV